MNPVSHSVEITPFAPEHGEAFFTLNKAWIDRYFQMEPIDYEVLGDPGAYILGPGGAIWVASIGKETVGVCALMPDPDNPGDFELTKMGVAPEYQGIGIGFALGQAVLKDAYERGAYRVFLESNTVLKPAIALYRKLGFREFRGRHSPYQRCNIQMEILFR